MMTYITAFIFYTLAMVGILLVGFIIYKKTFIMNKSENKGMIKILDSYPIGPKKTLLVIKIRNEKFLIASGAEHTTFLAKLADDNSTKNAVDKKQISQNLSSEQLIKKQNTINFEDEKQQHLEKISKQFMDLYEKEDSKPQKSISQVQNKHQLMRQLLEELSETKANVGSGRY